MPENPRPQAAHTHAAIDTERKIVYVSAVAIRNEQGLVLTVRKTGASGDMMPGGKPDAGETPLGAAVPALNENGYTVRAETYEYLPHPSEYEVLAALTPQAEIAELRWVDPAQNRDATQAPLNIECIFPVLSAHPR